MTTPIEWLERINAARLAAASVKAAPGPLSLPALLPRRFGLIAGLRRAPPYRAEGIARSEQPDSRVVATLAPRLDSILLAEQSALELAERLLPWGATLPDAIEWFVVDGPMPRITDFGSAFSCAQWSVEAAVEEAGATVTIDESVDDGSGFCRACVQAYANWQQAISKDLEVPSNHWPPEAVKSPLPLEPNSVMPWS